LFFHLEDSGATLRSAVGRAEARPPDLTVISNAATAQIRQALEKRSATQQVLADLDAKATQENANDLAGIERPRLHLLLARRLQFARNCCANGRAFEVAPTAGSTVFDIRAVIIANKQPLRLCRHILRVFAVDSIFMPKEVARAILDILGPLEHILIAPKAASASLQPYKAEASRSVEIHNFFRFANLKWISTNPVHNVMPC
jgi:hypothetical protein